MQEKLTLVKLLKVYDNGRTELIDVYNYADLNKSEPSYKKEVGKVVKQALYIIKHIVSEYCGSENKELFLEDEIDSSCIHAFRLCKIEFEIQCSRDAVTRKLDIQLEEFKSLLCDFIVNDSDTLKELLIRKLCSRNANNKDYINDEFEKLTYDIQRSNIQE